MGDSPEGEDLQGPGVGDCSRDSPGLGREDCSQVGDSPGLGVEDCSEVGDSVGLGVEDCSEVVRCEVVISGSQ